MTGDRSSPGLIRYRTRRLPPHGIFSGQAPVRPVSDIEVRVGSPISDPGATEHFLSARFGLHTSIAGKGVWVPNTHRPWPLRHATVTRLTDALVAATGLPNLPSQRMPDHVMFSHGVFTRFGLPQPVGR